MILPDLITPEGGTELKWLLNNDTVLVLTMRSDATKFGAVRGDAKRRITKRSEEATRGD